MDTRFEKAENSMSFRFTVNRMLIMLQVVLMMYSLFLKVYFMSVINVISIIVFIYCYKLSDNRQQELYYKVAYYEIFAYAAVAACIMGAGYGFQLGLIAMLPPVALSMYAGDSKAQGDNRFFKCYFSKTEGIIIVSLTILVYLLTQGFYHYKIDFSNLVPVRNDLVMHITYVVNFIVVISYVYYYLYTYGQYVKKNEEFLRQTADYDELTGLYNRNRMQFILDHNYNVAREGNMNFGVAIMDIDDFKKINDSYGHIAGDFVLKKFAGIVNGIVKKCEGQIVAGRWGGEEFLVIYYGDNKEDFYMLLEYIRMNICDTSFVFDRNKINVSATMGMSLFEVGQTLEELVNNADMKLYEGKRSGKNKVL